MSLSSSVFSVYMSQMMVEFMDQNIWIKQVFFTRHVDGPLFVHIAPKSPFLSLGQADPQARPFHSVMTAECG